MAKKKKPPRIEGPPQASLEEINEVLLAKSGKAKPTAGAGASVIKKTKKSASKSAPTSSAKKSVDGAKLALELLEASTTQLLRRKGWFRDVRLRRSADAYLRSSKLFQKASARQLGKSGTFDKPSPTELSAFEEELCTHLEGLRNKLGSVPMNETREISLKSAGPGQVIGAKLKGLKQRAAELEKKPRSVIKGAVRKKRRPLGSKKSKEAGEDD
ncbi:unnamed protein product [Cladocopium goreaui]|uniref:Uncharacterized protein n=1 Tax=Cladocopium goreaui TaxID=2562237 RepID=A0A9P1D105_9DINO|nr:unnamed protein product [Cladocopium goreaui]